MFTNNPPIANSQNRNHAWRCHVIVVRDLKSTHQISNPAIRELVQQRIQDLSELGFELTEVGQILIIEATDTIATVEHHIGVAISAYEHLQQHPSCYEITYVVDQAGRGFLAIAPRTGGIDPDLLAMCEMHAYVAPPDGTP
jgi:hypothetical protein